MWPVSRNFLGAILQPYDVTSRVELWYGNSRIVDRLKVGSGSVKGSTSLIRRTLDDVSFTAPSAAERRRLWEQVSLPGAEVRAFRGIRFLDGSLEECPLGVFVTQTPSFDERTGIIRLGSCPDRMQRVVNATFEVPRTSSTGFTHQQQIQQLLGEVIPGLSFSNRVMAGSALPPAVWETDRAGAIRQLATSIGAEVWFTPDGGARLARPKQFSDQADWSLRPRENYSEASAKIDWSSAFNVVVARGDRVDGAEGVYGIARDTDPASATYWRGPMGPNVRQYASPLLTSNTMAVLAAQSLLAKSTGARRSIDLTTVANPALEVGDRVDVLLPNAGWVERHIVDGFSIDLTSAAMTVTTRATGTIGEADA